MSDKDQVKEKLDMAFEANVKLFVSRTYTEIMDLMRERAADAGIPKDNGTLTFRFMGRVVNTLFTRFYAVHFGNTTKAAVEAGDLVVEKTSPP